MSINEFSLLANIDWKSFVAGTTGGATSTALFHPLDLIKIRWQVYENASLKLFKNPTSQVVKDTKLVNRPQYKGLLDTISSVYKTENGFRGLYRGVMINTLASGSAWGNLSYIHISSSFWSNLTIDIFQVYISFCTMALRIITSQRIRPIANSSLHLTTVSTLHWLVSQPYASQTPCFLSKLACACSTRMKRIHIRTKLSNIKIHSSV